MKKISKAVSVLLSFIMAISCFSASAISASAATVDSESTGVDTLQQRLDKGHQIVKFRFPDTVWGARSALR